MAAKAKKETGKQIKVTLVKSPIGYTERQKGTVRALGLRRMNQSVTHTDTPALRGMVTAVGHLLKVEEA
jgi:large subunit ribosomal protein L30